MPATTAVVRLARQTPAFVPKYPARVPKKPMFSEAALTDQAAEAASGAQATALSVPTADFGGVLLAAGIAVGLAELFSAWMQGKIGAAGIRAISEGEGKGFVFIIIAMGIAETVGVFAMVFTLGMIPGMK